VNSLSCAKNTTPVLLMSTSVVRQSKSGVVTSFQMNLGKRLKQARERRKLTQEQLSAAVTNASQAMISALEKRDSLTTTLLFQFADALKVNPRWLLNGGPLADSWLDKPPEKKDELELQLIDIYGKLSQDGRDALLANANRIFSKENPGKSTANPFPAATKETTRSGVPAKTR